MKTFSRDSSKLIAFILGRRHFPLLDVEQTSEADAREIKKGFRTYYLELCKEIRRRIDFNDATLNAVNALNPKQLGESLMPQNWNANGLSY